MTNVIKNSPQLNRATPLFECLVPTQGFTHANDIVIRVLSGRRNVGGIVEDVVHFEITDQKDPYIMYFIDICETNLVKLKEQYKINPDVALLGVPEMIDHFLEKCLQGVFDVKELSSKPINYFARMNVDDGLFTVMEKNQYSSDVVHLTLPMQKGDDKDVQEYLASRLELSLSVASSQAASIENLNATLQNELQQKEAALKELNDLRTMTDVRQQSSESTHSQELSQMRMDCANQKEEQRKIFEEEKAALRAELSKLIAHAHTEQSTFDKERLSFEKHAMDTDATIRELQRKLASEIASRERMETEWVGTSAKKGEIETQFVNVQGEKAQLDARLKLLTEQLASKVETIANQQKLLSSSESAYRKMEERLSEVQATLQETQRHLLGSQEQSADQAAFIQKLEDRLAKHAERLKMKDETLRRQEVVVNEFRDKYNTAHNALVEAREKEKTTQLELLGEKDRHAQTMDLLNKANDKIAHDKEVMVYLSEQVNQFQLTGGYVHQPTSTAADYTSSYTPHATPAGVHSVTPGASGAYQPRSQPRTGGTASSDYTPNLKYDFLGAGAGAGAGVSPDTNFTAPYAYPASSSRTGAGIPITTTNASTTATNYVRAPSYQHQQHMQAVDSSYSSTADAMVRTAEKFGLVGYGEEYFSGLLRESPIHSEESSGSSSGGRGGARGARGGSGAGAGAGAGVGGVSSGRGSGGGSGNKIASAIQEIDLEEMAFYSLPSEKRATPTTSSGASPPHKSSRLPVRAGAGASPAAATSTLYSWQDPDFGKV